MFNIIFIFFIETEHTAENQFENPNRAKSNGRGVRIKCRWNYFFMHSLFSFHVSMPYETPLKCMTLKAIWFIRLNDMIADTNTL